MPYLGIACHCAVGLIFGMSALSKLRGRAAFTEFVAATLLLMAAVLGPRRPVSSRGTRRASVAVVSAEAAVPPLVLVPGTARFGLALGLALLVVFSVGIAAALRRGVRTSCRCFGGSAAPLGRRHLARNAAVSIVAALGLLAGTGAGGDPGGLALAALAGLVAALLVARLDDLVALFGTPPTAPRPAPSHVPAKRS